MLRTTRFAMLTALTLLPLSAAQAVWQERGDASWYGAYHQGRRASDGSVFDANSMTAAHTTLPLGTVVRVTSDTTGQSVVVTITDRLPQKHTRIIDLSRGAASRIGLVQMGVGAVTLAETGTLPDEDLDDAEASLQPHGRPRRRRVSPMAAAGHQCCQRPSVVRVRSSVQRLAAPHTL